MMHDMIRKKQLLSEKESIEILKKATSGVLAVNGDDGYPYTIPISYAYDEGKIIFHGGKRGYKYDAICKEPKVSFCVIDKDEIVADEYTTYYRSVVAFGKVEILKDKNEIINMIDTFAKRYRPGHEQERQALIEKELPALCVYVLNIEHITGKEARELVDARAKND